MNRTIRSIAIVGAGAMGTLFAARLAHNPDLDVTVLSRSFTGVQVEVEGEGRVSVRITRQPPTDVDLLIVLVKAYATADAVRWAAGAIGPDTLLLTLQNGLGNAEHLARAAGGARVLAGVTAQGATLLGAGLVRHGGTGATQIAPWHPRGAAADAVDGVAEVLSTAGIPTSVEADPKLLLWRKLVVNAAINPLTAILRVPNGVLLEHSSSVALMRSAAREALSAAAAEGVLLGADLVHWVEEVARATAPNRSSMLQDVERGRRTEIDAISGTVVKVGHRRGVAVPVTETLFHLITAMHRN